MMKWVARSLDIVVALVALGVYLPVFVVAAILIRWEDGGAVFFVQERLGKGRVPFRVLKLRTMRDGRVTKVGRWLRATALDEFPQFVHVLRGEMRVVGPRPLTQADVDRLSWQGELAEARWGGKPGVTGMIQVFGAGTTASESLQLDLDYELRRNLATDVWMMVLSVLVNIVGKSRARGWWRGGMLAQPQN